MKALDSGELNLNKVTNMREERAVMADEKIGKKPDKDGGVGAEKDHPENTEDGGRSGSKLLYTCWRDGAGNYVPGNWSWFICWRCGTLNYL